MTRIHLVRPGEGITDVERKLDDALERNRAEVARLEAAYGTGFPRVLELPMQPERHDEIPPPPRPAYVPKLPAIAVGVLWTWGVLGLAGLVWWVLS